MRAALIMFVGLGIGFAHAQPAPEGDGDVATELADQAQDHFKSGRFCEAVQTYRRAYQVEPLSELLYNIAYIHDRKLEDPEVARVYYRRYVSERDTDRDIRLKAYERLDALDKLAGDPPSKTPLVMAPEATAEEGGGMREAAEGVGDTVVPSSGSDMRTGAWIALGIGAAATITGATFAVLATHSHSEFEGAKDAAARRQLADEGEQRALIGDVGLAVGLAGLATGGVLYLLSDDADETVVGIAPGPDGFNIGLSARF